MAYQRPLPQIYLDLSSDELIARIHAAKKKLGSSLVLLAHHYQRPEVVELSDYRGDSLKLAQFAANESGVRYVVFCGVHFMAESADILKRDNEVVVLPDMGAGCDMADMADAEDVKEAWNDLTECLGHEDIMPITYINSTAALKAFVGKKGGVVCTSSNAEKIISWGLTQRKHVFFFPDQHLGRNTCWRMGIPLNSMSLWDPKASLGGNEAAQLKDSRVFLWKGHCPVHAMFSERQIEKLLAKDADFKIISHPECELSVVQRSHFVGSTEFIVSTIAKSSPGSKWAVGTEMNLVNRIAKENPDKTVVSINPYMCLCGTMNRIDLPHLSWALDALVRGAPVNRIEVFEPVRSNAKLALDRMLAMS